MRVELFGVDDGERMAEALAVRGAVFVAEQGVPAEEEIDAHDRDDPQARHALLRVAGRVIAAGRFYRLDERTAQIGRMAVLGPERGRGRGRAILDALVDEARARGYRRVALNAQDHAVGFYRRAGFTPCGSTLVECEIVHQPMERELEA